jgi:hypothetical protein
MRPTPIVNASLAPSVQSAAPVAATRAKSLEGASEVKLKLQNENGSTYTGRIIQRLRQRPEPPDQPPPPPGDLDLAGSDPEAAYRQRFSHFTAGRITDPALDQELPCHLGVRFAVALTRLPVPAWAAISRREGELPTLEQCQRQAAVWERRLGKQAAGQLVDVWDSAHAATEYVALGSILHHMEIAADLGQVRDFEGWDQVREWFMYQGQGSRAIGPAAGYLATRPYCLEDIGVNYLAAIGEILPFTRIATTRLQSDRVTQSE